MQKNFKFEIAYDGSRYYGWEHQPNIEATIQGKLENVLGKMTSSDIEVIGAGRTDAGVHAVAMTANAVLDTNMSPNDILEYMNRYLPDDIIVNNVVIASDRFHARYKAVGKTYRYTCYLGKIKPLFDRKYLWFLNCDKSEIDIEAIKCAAELLTGEHDYMSFCGNSKMKKSTVRIVDSISISTKGNYLYFYFHGTGFLQHMVRILTGTLIEVGFGKRDPQSMSQLLEARNRSLAGQTAPAQGLCLMKVDY